MADILVIARIKQKNGQTFALLEDVDLQGGYRVVADTTARDAIPADSRKEGMQVLTIADRTLWTLNAGLTDSDWAVLQYFDTSTGLVGFEDIQFGAPGDVIPTEGNIRFRMDPSGRVLLSIVTPNGGGTIPIVTDSLQATDELVFGAAGAGFVYQGTRHFWATPEGDVQLIESYKHRLAFLLAGLSGPLGLYETTVTFASGDHTLAGDDLTAVRIVCDGVMGGTARELNIPDPGALRKAWHIIDASKVDQTVIVQPANGGDGIQVLAGGVTEIVWDEASSEWVKKSEGPFYTSPQHFDGDVFIANPTFGNGPIIQASPAISDVISADGKVRIIDYAYSDTTATATPKDIITTFSPTLLDEAVHAFDGQVTAIRADGGVDAVFDFKYRGRRDGGTWTQNEAATVTPSPTGTSLALAVTVSSNKLAVTATGIAATDYRWGIAYRHQSTVY